MGVRDRLESESIRGTGLGIKTSAIRSVQLIVEVDHVPKIHDGNKSVSSTR